LCCLQVWTQTPGKLTQIQDDVSADQLVMATCITRGLFFPCLLQINEPLFFLSDREILYGSFNNHSSPMRPKLTCMFQS
jgi:hypothetical protein